ncbi:unnamed protein product [Paramecium sonneborni]|uniref:Uncharacterized protein n=1 Tax=Paramecium sonneborni TaxID=65129 RepID=A0A8S1QWH5_9CILI|nr:unnamed protein product [Paramecium sonneborni]
MLNIKIVYQRKVHKLPTKIGSYQEIIEAIKTLYPQIKEVHLFTNINPSEPDGFEEINCEPALTFLKKMYQQFGWPTIKFLVLENLNDLSQLKNSMDLLNQSQIFSDKSNYLDQPKINKAIQKQEIDSQQNEKIQQNLIQLIDNRLRFYNLIGNSNQDNEMILKARKLSHRFTQYSYEWILDFVKQQGNYVSYEHLAELLSENQ